jgi:hypothetical protein
MADLSLSKINASKCSELLCPTPGCSKHISPADLKQLLSPEDFERYQDVSLKEVISANPSAFVQCPNPKCNLVIERLSNHADGKEQVLGPDGKPLTPEALAHRANNRFRFV